MDRIPVIATSHFALSVPEILLEILEKLSANELAVAALVCKTWTSHAVDAIWTTTGISLRRLLEKLAPIKTGRVERTVLAPSSPITRDHWDYFLDRYANRITRLVVDMDLDKTSVKLLTTLLNRFGGQFCANVVSFDWATHRFINNSYRSLFNLLPGSKLRDVKLPAESSADLPAPPEPDTITLLADRAPYISKLTVDRLSSSFNFAVFSQLRWLWFGGDISPSDYRNLSSCQSLEFLYLSGTVAWNTSEPQNYRPAISFPSLQHFNLCWSSEELQYMIQLSSVMPALRTFMYHSRNCMEPVTINLINNTLQTSPLIDKLNIQARRLTSNPQLVPHDLVRSLSLSSWRDTGSIMKGADLSTIGRSFPMLSELTLRITRQGSVVFARYPRSWHWHTLGLLGTHLRHLQSMTISLHVPTFSTSDLIAINSVPLRSLSSLTFEFLYIQATARDPFISYLAMLCPNVHDLRVHELRESYNDRSGLRDMTEDAAAFVRRFFYYSEGGFEDDEDSVVERETLDTGLLAYSDDD
ncbi:hypothetical protein FRB97_001028 [Tulasnella sp. 331]|nr:hypothetical protein FRB97_001028 [Tulasnella sp. 331]